MFIDLAPVNDYFELPKGKKNNKQKRSWKSFGIKQSSLVRVAGHLLLLPMSRVVNSLDDHKWRFQCDVLGMVCCLSRMKLRFSDCLSQQSIH